MATSIFNILSLNEDCIMKIFSYLAPAEIIKFVAAIPQFYITCEDYLIHEGILPLDHFVKYYPQNLITQTMNRVGSELKHITFDAIGKKNVDNYLKLLIDHCKHIESLELHYLPAFNHELWSQLLRGLNLLKKFIVSFSSINDEIIELLTHTPLEELTVTRANISGKHINKLKNLSKLGLEYCDNLSSEHVKAILQSIKLETLDIHGSSDLDDSVFSTLTTTQQRLSTLRMSSNYYGACLDPIAKLPSLKQLYIFDDGTESKCYALFEELANCKDSKLECLEVSNMWISEEGLMNDLICKMVNLRRLGLIYDRYVDDEFLKNISISLPHLGEFLCPAACDITNDGILEFIKNANALKLLDLTHCVKLTSEILTNIIKILKEKKNSTGPLLICVMGTKINESILESEEYKNNKHLLTLSFAKNRNYSSTPNDLYNLDEDY